MRELLGERIIECLEEAMVPLDEPFWSSKTPRHAECPPVGAGCKDLVSLMDSPRLSYHRLKLGVMMLLTTATSRRPDCLREALSDSPHLPAYWKLAFVDE